MSEADQELNKAHVNEKAKKPEDAQESPLAAENKHYTWWIQISLMKKSISFLRNKHYKWWIQMITYSFFLIAGQSLGTLLGRLYFNNGGNSQWIATLVQVVGFPVLIPFQWFTTTAAKKKHQTNTDHYDDRLTATAEKRLPFYLSLPFIYVVTGIFVAGDCMLYTIGLKYLPVTTYTLICASQLAFNSLFSYILNKQKFTPYIVNSLVILTISSVLLVFQTDPGDSNKTTKQKYFIGFICTLAASAGYALMLSIMQLAFQRIIKKEAIRSVIDMAVYQNAVATIVIVVGIFASGEWRKYGKEMDGYEAGKVSYVMNLFGTAVSWQAFSMGCIGLIFKVSSLFSNVISVLGLPVAPVLAVIFLGDKLTGLKAMSLLLAVWGFVSYMYQHYLDDLEMKKKLKRSENGEEDTKIVSEVPLVNNASASASAS